MSDNELGVIGTILFLFVIVSLGMGSAMGRGEMHFWIWDELTAIKGIGFNFGTVGMFVIYMMFYATLFLVPFVALLSLHPFAKAGEAAFIAFWAMVTVLLFHATLYVIVAAVVNEFLRWSEAGTGWPWLMIAWMAFTLFALVAWGLLAKASKERAVEDVKRRSGISFFGSVEAYEQNERAVEKFEREKWTAERKARRELEAQLRSERAET